MSTKQKRKCQNRKRKYLTQKQAWLEIAEAYKTANEYTSANIRGLHVVGLCGSVNRLRNCSAISSLMRTIMICKIRAFGKRKKISGFYWDFTKEGETQRVRFCQRMARLCMKKRKN